MQGELLDGILRAACCLGHSLPEALAPGLAALDVKAQYERLSLKCPSELLQLYTWRNGTRLREVDGEICFFPGYIFLSLEEAFAIYSAVSPCFDDPQMSDYWRTGWIPIFHDTGGGYYAIDCSDLHTQKIVKISQGSSSEPYFESLES